MDKSLLYAQSLKSKEKIKKHYRKIEDIIFIHYACQSFDESSEGLPPRIHVISVREGGSEQTETFSIFEEAILSKEKLTIENYEKYEKQLLENFFNYLYHNKSKTWIHWAMRDTMYGFNAIERRAKLHDINLKFPISHLNKVDLKIELEKIYGSKFVEHPELLTLAEKNSINYTRHLDGESEAKAFNSQKYTELKNSVLRKTNILNSIFERVALETLQTDKTIKSTKLQHFFDRYNGSWWFWIITLLLGGIIGWGLNYLI